MFVGFRRVLAALALLVCLQGSQAIEREPWEAFQARRRALAERHSDSIIVLFGYSEHEGRRGATPFRQESNFYYLTGLNEPGAALLVLPAAADRPYRETLFLAARNPEREAWDGPRIDPEAADAPARTGFAAVETIERLAAALDHARERFDKAAALGPRSSSDLLLPEEPDSLALLDKYAPGLEAANLRATLTRLRSIKSEGEVRLIQKAVDATIAAHRASWEQIRPGLREHQVAGVFLGVLLDRGCLRAAYPPIIASGPNSAILHYSKLESTLDRGELLLMDVGGERSFYAADITRTLPVSGRFSKRQRRIYEIVLEAHKAVLAAVRPGVTLVGAGPGSLERVARRVFRRHGMEKRFLHGIGHHVGLDVHDPRSPHAPLKPGMVITVEPGLYFPEEGFGVRIEDMALVTADGARVLSSALPTDPDEIERILNGRRDQSTAARAYSAIR